MCQTYIRYIRRKVVWLALLFDSYAFRTKLGVNAGVVINFGVIWYREVMSLIHCDIVGVPRPV